MLQSFSDTAVQSLGERLRQCGAVTTNQLQKASSACLETDLPIGWILVNTGIISTDLLNSVINVERLVHQGTLTAEQATEVLKIVRLKQMDLFEVLDDHGVDTEVVDMEMAWCKLLIDSGLLTESELFGCREIALCRKESIGQTLLSYGYIDESTQTLIVAAIDQIVSDSISLEDAVQSLRKLYQQQNRQPDSSSNISVPSLVHFIQLTKLITNEELSIVFASAQQKNQPLEKELVEQSLVEQMVLDQIKKCQHILGEQLITLRQAAILASYCSETKCDLEEALSQFGWGNFPCFSSLQAIA